MNNNENNNEKLDIVVFTTTFYTSLADLRCRVALSTLRSLGRLNIPAVVIDASPSDSGVLQALQSTSNIHIVQPQSSKEKNKGVALREALATAVTMLETKMTEDTWLAFQEPEKVNLPPHWNRIFRSSSSSEVGQETAIVVPKRNDESFKTTYPMEQYHSEMFGNMYLDSVARDSLSSLPSTEPPPPPIDWLFGPFALRKRHANLWLNYNGKTYDAQIVPIVRAMRLHQQVQSIPIHFEASQDMKIVEEGNVDFIEKRLHQLVIWQSLIKKAWTEDFDVSSSKGGGDSFVMSYSSLRLGSSSDLNLNDPMGMSMMILVGVVIFFYTYSKRGGKFFRALNTHMRKE